MTTPSLGVNDDGITLPPGYVKEDDSIPLLLDFGNRSETNYFYVH